MTDNTANWIDWVNPPWGLYLEEGMNLFKVGGIFLLLCGACLTAQAAVPEIDPGSAVSGLALLSGAMLIMRGRKR
jgi:hypothetical protein